MSDKTRLKRKIHAREFAALELALYLDTHPADHRAVEMRRQLRQEIDRLKTRYETRYGPLIVTQDDTRGDEWTWIRSPWPWTYQKEV
ncbi:MAG: spore coat protein CotJB [Acutalibacteraceae bacterium]|jgi:spore coat protein JB